ncbi:hypothetical protein NEIRO03_0170 [Nematocida sp. AWRm78]|nr:hypothetical protein NEIRO02_0016 [Nematocida sp. AWRm79]KAI5182486.1 hypothetical protein NEIRO03_0170 [Nematocida sp. AWRm78]
MKILSSLGIILALGGVMVQASTVTSNGTTVGGSSTDISSHKSAIDSTDSGEVQVGKLSKEQMKLINGWNKGKNADSIARRLKLRTALRVTLYLPIEEPLSLNDLGPNSKLEILSALIGMGASVKADSASSMHTTLPPEYARLAKQQQQSETTTSSSSAKSSSSSKSSTKTKRSSRSSGLVQESVEEEEEEE